MSALAAASESISASTSRASSPSRRVAIDLIKGLAIVSVIVLHTVPRHILNQTAAIFHIWQAVPVFMCVMGLNGVASLRRRGMGSLRDIYSRDYLAARFDRIVVPFALAFAGTVLVAGITHRSHYDAFMFIGALPIGGPGGNYFISLIFQYALLIPLVYWGLRRWRMRTLLLCLAINIAFEIIAPRVSIFEDHPYLYSVSALRFLFLVALGGAVAGVSPSRLLGSWWLWLGALLGAAYLVLVYTDANAIPIAELAYRSETFPGAFYPLLMVVAGMWALPTVAHGTLTRGIAELGRASYHIFLVQIIWFGAIIWAAGSWAALLPNLAGALAIGLLFYRLTTKASFPGAMKLLASTRRSQAAPQRTGDELASLAALSSRE
jgi:peptidoglycan/LPS O-acetylase OafA/YrhL